MEKRLDKGERIWYSDEAAPGQEFRQRAKKHSEKEPVEEKRIEKRKKGLTSPKRFSILAMFRRWRACTL